MSSTAQMEEELALVSVNESNSATYDILLKIMALGDTGVGKSCFLVQVQSKIPSSVMNHLGFNACF